MSQLECSRCGGGFPLEADHTEIVRRDFLDEPQPSTIEHLCGPCLQEYREEFMGIEELEAGVPGRGQDAES